jgi:hypothetical protein
VGRAAVPAIVPVVEATCRSLAFMAGTAARPTIKQFQKISNCSATTPGQKTVTNLRCQSLDLKSKHLVRTGSGRHYSRRRNERSVVFPRAPERLAKCLHSMLT